MCVCVLLTVALAVSVLELHREVGCIRDSNLKLYNNYVLLTVAVSVLELHREVGCIIVIYYYQRFKPEVVVQLTVAVSVLELHREVGCIRDSNLKLYNNYVLLTVAVSVLELRREVGCITVIYYYQRFKPEVVVQLTVAVSVLELHREVGCIRNSNLKLYNNYVLLTVAVSVLELRREVGCIIVIYYYQRFKPEVVVQLTVAVSVLELHREVGCIRNSNLKLYRSVCQ